MPSTDRSIISYGPACAYIRMEDCELGGITGLLIPDSKVLTSHSLERLVPDDLSMPGELR